MLPTPPDNHPPSFDPMTFNPAAQLEAGHLGQIMTIASALSLIDSLRGMVRQLQMQNGILESQARAANERQMPPIVLADAPTEPATSNIAADTQAHEIE